jgi:hypothetical protein
MGIDDVEHVFLRVRREDIAYIKFIIESYEGVGVVRTVDRHAATIVILSTPDFADDVREIIRDVGRRVPCQEIPRPPETADDWLMRPELDGEP